MTQQRNEITITLAKDRASASLTIPAGYDPSMLTPDTLAMLARAHGVVVDAPEHESITAICAAFSENPGESTTAIFASAIPPQRGDEAQVVWHEGFDPDAVPEDSGDEHVDHYSTHSLTLVHEGDPVATIVERKAGVEGRDVLGNAIPAPRGVDAPIVFDPKTFETRDDGTVNATRNGVLRLRHGECTVDEVLNIRGNVDFNSGNIDTEGAVLVSGGVKDRFVLRAKKDVEVRGLVEAATIETEGSLVLRKGMSARENGSVTVGGDLDAGFLSGMRGEIVGDLRLKREAMGCSLNIGGSIVAPGASIIGGETAASGSIEIGTLGSGAEAPTVLRVGSLPLLERELDEAKAEQAEVEKSLKALDERESQLKAMSAVLTPQQKEQFTEIEFLRMDAMQRFEQATQRVSEIEAQLKTRAKVQLTVRSMIYPRVSIVTEQQSVTVPSPIRGPVTFSWSDEHRLLIQRLDGTWYDAEATVRKAA